MLMLVTAGVSTTLLFGMQVTQHRTSTGRNAAAVAGDSRSAWHSMSSWAGKAVVVGVFGSILVAASRRIVPK
jgi:hypothetical protein